MSTNDHRLARLFDPAVLARVVPHLPPDTLHQLIRYRGLDACGELVTSATPAQLTTLIDLDLWRLGRRGQDEQFDVDRFGEWLEVLVDTGESVAARTVAALDTRLVVAGLSRFVRVFDPGVFEPTAQDDDELTDRREAMREGDHHSRKRNPSEDGLECEVGGYLVRARRTDAWDAIVTLLGALETEHSGCFRAVMQGCRGLSNSRPEVDGLDDLLMAPEQHLHDLAIERELRRSRQGYATPGDARALLQMARDTPRTPGASAPSAMNPIAMAYFRATEAEEEVRVERSCPGDIPAAVEAVLDMLAAAGVRPERPQARLEAADKDRGAVRLPLLTRLMQSLLGDESVYLARNRELAFLANTLLAGSSVQSRSFTPEEASNAAACICNLGLECRGTPDHPDGLLIDHNLVAAFHIGWAVLYEEVSLFAADQLISTLAELRSVDAETERGLRALRRTLVKQREAGTPWLARDAADVIATLDTTAWIGVRGLLDECPILPAALTAVLERWTTPVSPTAFEFISTKAQIGEIRVFMRTLPSVLSR